MAASANRRFRLEARFGVECDAGGVTLAGVPLLRRTRQGWRSRSGLELRFLLERAYHEEIDSERLEQKLDGIAQALDEGTVTRAMIGALLLNLPALDGDGAARLARAEDTLTKFDPDEPRDAAGRWTTGVMAMRRPAGLRIPSAPTRTGPSPVWDLPPTARGYKIHEEFGANLPHNFPVIDREADGIVISIKSIDLSAPTYQNALRLLRRLNRYVDQLAEFEGKVWGGTQIEKDAIISRELKIVSPRGGRSSASDHVFKLLKERANDLDIDVHIIEY